MRRPQRKIQAGRCDDMICLSIFHPLSQRSLDLINAFCPLIIELRVSGERRLFLSDGFVVQDILIQILAGLFFPWHLVLDARKLSRAKSQGWEEEYSVTSIHADCKSFVRCPYLSFQVHSFSISLLSTAVF